jgi:AAA+ ATPase superfamily predicted ATPase
MKARSKEKNKIIEFLNDNSTNVALVLGRSGMGKSQLLKNLVNEYQGVYFAAYPTTDDMELKLLSNAIYGRVDTTPEEYKDIESLCKKVLEIADSEKPYLFIIDNYPDFVKANSSYDNRFPSKSVVVFISVVQKESKLLTILHNPLLFSRIYFLFFFLSSSIITVILFFFYLLFQ